MTTRVPVMGVNPNIYDSSGNLVAVLEPWSGFHETEPCYNHVDSWEHDVLLRDPYERHFERLFNKKAPLRTLADWRAGLPVDEEYVAIRLQSLIRRYENGELLT